MTTSPQDLLARRRDRTIALILAAKERECDAYLPKENSSRFRKVILDQLNDLTALASDLLSMAEGDGKVFLNDLYLQKMDQILEAVQNGKAE